jgi:RNA polymerase sigma-70 factor (ECF subfamily)
MNLKKEMLALTPKLRAHAWVLSRGAPDADDLVQETLLRAWQGRHSFEPGGNLKSWMFRILRTVFLASLAGGLKTSQSPVRTPGPGGPYDGDPEWRARFGELIDALADLPEQDCEALLLVAGSGLTYEEAAEVCYCSVGAIKARVSRARERLCGLVGEPLAAAERQGSRADTHLTN